jgi:hypothetical protein
MNPYEFELTEEEQKKYVEERIRDQEALRQEMARELERLRIYIRTGKYVPRDKRDRVE